jgi:hypothetical protein
MGRHKTEAVSMRLCQGTLQLTAGISNSRAPAKLFRAKPGQTVVEFAFDPPQQVGESFILGTAASQWGEGVAKKGAVDERKVRCEPKTQ